MSNKNNNKEFDNNADNSNIIIDEEKYNPENFSVNVTYEDIETCKLKYLSSLKYQNKRWSG